MKISLQWVRDYVALPAELDAKTIAHDLTLSTVEVEGVLSLGASLDKIFVAKIAAIEPHPNADRLKLVRCDIGAGAAGEVTVVCGGGNLELGMKIALALVGASVLWHGEGEPVVLEPTKVRGVESAGMICAANEIGLSDLFPPTDANDIVDLSGLDSEPGTALAEAIGFDDDVLEIDNKSLSNRPDLWGHYGIARELAARYELPLEPLPSFTERPGPGDIEIAIADSKLCSRYTGTQIADVRVEPAPLWMRSRLARIGQRPINLLVDLTNYVMCALGQPSHAFDQRRLSGAIEIRGAAANETLETLDGTKLVLDGEDLVIADQTHAVALAGVMGGLDSSIEADTSALFLEIGTFDAVAVRRCSARHDIRTESSTRFEKALTPALVDEALGLFISQLRAIQPDVRVLAFCDAYPAVPAPVHVEVELEFLRRRIGEALTRETIVGYLDRLGFTTTGEGEVLDVEVPPWRATGDVSLPEDIVEEVARSFGYNNLRFTPPQVSFARAVRQPRYRLERAIRAYLAGPAGMREMISYPWVPDRFLDAVGMADVPCIALDTPPAPSTRRIQPSLLPQQVAAAASNLRFYDEFSIFELGYVFSAESEHSPNHPDERLPTQRKQVAGTFVGPSADAGRLFLTAKGVLETLSRHAQAEPLSLVQSDTAPAWADPRAYLEVHAGDRRIGHLGVLNGRGRRLASIRRGALALFELDLSAIEPLPSRDNRFAPLPEYPHVEWDFSFLFGRDVHWDRIRATVAGASALVREISFVDEYTGKQVPSDKKSVTFRLRLRADDRTLTNEEVSAATESVSAALSEQLGGQLRP